MREIVLDTETTGLSPDAGHRIIEIGAIELNNGIPTGKNFWRYINPERDVPLEAQQIHGITTEFLADKPLFDAVAEEFLEFIAHDKKQHDPIIIHNAGFDVKFLNWELARLGHVQLVKHRVIDTLETVRRKFPGAPASLDALCRRFNISNAHRTLHGALLDAELLSEVYIELTGRRQRDLMAGLLDADAPKRIMNGDDETDEAVQILTPRVFTHNDDELAAHEEFLNTLTDPLWRRA